MELICLLAFFQVVQYSLAQSMSSSHLFNGPNSALTTQKQVLVNVQDSKLKQIENRRTLLLKEAAALHLQERTKINEDYSQEVTKASTSSGNYSPPTPYTNEEVSGLFSVIWRNQDFEDLKLQRAKDLTDLMGWRNDQIMNIKTNSLIAICDSFLEIYQKKIQNLKTSKNTSAAKIDKSEEMKDLESKIKEIQSIKNQFPNFTGQNRYQLYMLILSEQNVQTKEINDKFVQDSEKFRGIYQDDLASYLAKYKEGNHVFSISEHIRLLTLRRDNEISLATQKYRSRVSQIEQGYKMQVDQWHTESAKGLLNIH